MKILVTGSNGFIGKNVDEFLKKSYKNVFTPKRQELDLTDFNLVKKYIQKNNFDIIIHCAVSLSNIEHNLKMYSNLKVCSNDFGKMIVVGSGAEYNPKHYRPMMKEEYFGTYVPDKNDIYSYSKFKIAKDIEQNKKNIFNLRVFGIYGKYENYNRRFISNTICRILANKEIMINQNSIFDYLFIDDFCNLLKKFFEQDAKENSYNLCTSIPIDLITLANYVKNIAKYKGPINIKNENIKMNYTGDNKRFINEFGKYNFINPEIAIQKLYRWYKKESKIKFDTLNFN